MPLTSLAAQLKKLETPQTSLLFHKKTRPSFLFDAKEAAEFDRDTFYDLGLSGLEELKKLNPRFSDFEDTLFDITSKSFERAVETQETNKKLDSRIREFLALLSPYFLLRSAHKALEWLIHRYHVEQYNVADLLCLGLPYHETNTFGRLLGLLEIGDNDPAWLWLVPVRRASVPLSKTALLNRAATDMAFFRFVANMPDNAIKIHGKSASSLGTLFCFYCTTLLGALEYSSRVTELHVSHLLPSIMAALADRNLPDYTASAYIILARLMTKIQLAEKVVHGLYNKISKVEHAKLCSESVLMLVLMTQNDSSRASLPERAVKRIATVTSSPNGGWFVPTLVTLVETSVGLVVTPLVCGLLRTVLKMVQSGTDNLEELKRFVHDLLLGDLRFDDEDFEQVFRCLLEEFDENNNSATVTWYERFVRSLETRYPVSFDRVASAALSGDGSTNSEREARALKRFLGGSGGATRDQLFQRLVHPNARIRAEAVTHVGKHMRSDQVSWLHECLWDRLEDDIWEVVHAAVRLPQELLEALSQRYPGELTVRLARIVARSWTAKWHPTQSDSHKCLRPAVAALLRNSQPSEEDDALLVLVLTPLLIDSTLDKTQSLILNSQVSERIPFFKAIKGWIADEDMTPNPCEAVWEVLQQYDESLVIPSSEVTAGALARLADSASEGHQFLAALLTAMAIPKCLDLKATTDVITHVIKYVKSPNVRGDEDSPKLSALSLEHYLSEAVGQRMLPVQAVLHTLEIIAAKAPPVLDYHSHSVAGWVSFTDERDVLVLATLKLIVEGLSALDPAIKMAFTQVKYSYMKNYFPSQGSFLSFLISALILETDLGPEYLRILKESLEEASEDPWSELVELLFSRDSVIVPGLMLMMTSETEDTRMLAIDCLEAATAAAPKHSFYMPLATEVLECQEEIRMDPNQIAVVMYTRLSPSPDIQSVFISKEARDSMRDILDRLILAVVDRDATPLPVRTSLLQLIESVNSPDIYLRLLPIVDELTGKSLVLDKLESSLLVNVLRRLNETTAVCFSEADYWHFITRVLSDHSTRVQLEDAEKPASPAVILLNQISRPVFDALPDRRNNAKHLLELTVMTAVDSDSVEVGSATASMFKRLALDCSTLVELFVPMLAASVPTTATQQSPPKGKLKKKRLSSVPPLGILETSEWKRGVCLLEMIQGKKKLRDIHLLLPTLFEILKKCLAFEQQAPVEYTKQLVLSAVLHCCQHAGDGGDVSGCVQADLVVQCVRASHNPQTHHHALLALTHLARIVPDQVLHNIMAIFTFIGSSVLRQEDAYSLQIISQIIDTIIPVLIEAETDDLVSKVAGVLRVFVSAMLDIPEHRRLLLLKKLMQTLRDGEFLWVFLCLVFDTHVRSHNQQEEKLKGVGSMPRRLEVALQLCMEFQADIVLNTCHKILEHLVYMPHDKDETLLKESFRDVREIFNVEGNSGKQLRHYKYTLVTFLSSIVSSPHFVQQIAVMSDSEMLCLELVFRRVVEECLRFVKSVSGRAELCSTAPTAKYWKAMLNQSYDVLEKINALLPTDVFLGVVGGLMTEPREPVLRRKAMELLGWKLQQPGARLPPDSLSALLSPVVEVVESIGDDCGGGDVPSPTQEQQLSQQTALFTLKLMTRHLAPDSTETFKQILGKLSELLVWQSKTSAIIEGSTSAGSGGVVGSLVLCLAEVVSVVKAHSIVHLSKFMPAIIRILDTNLVAKESNLLFTMSLVTGLCKIMDCLARFLSPYLGRILYQVSVLSARSNLEANHQSATHKLKSIRSRVSSDIECRVLVPAVSQAFDELLKQGQCGAVAPLLSVLSEGFTKASDLTPELVSFFTGALGLRSSSPGVSLTEIATMEDAVIDCLTSVVLKLSESAFRPLYYRLYNWAVRAEVGRVERAITFYRLSSRIAESLKGLFVLFAGHFVSDAARLLDENNADKKQTDDGAMDTDDGAADVTTSCLLLDSVLRTLLTVFTYDSKHFVTKERFDILLQPLVDQLENLTGGCEVAKERWDKLVTPCLAEMAASTPDDTLWKQLSYQILLKTRHHSPLVRIAGLKTVHELARKLGEDFLPLLPEAVPFLAELLEDDEESVEKECQRVVADMEAILGEPIQKYF